MFFPFLFYEKYYEELISLKYLAMKLFSPEDFFLKDFYGFYLFNIYRTIQIICFILDEFWYFVVFNKFSKFLKLCVRVVHSVALLYC